MNDSTLEEDCGLIDAVEPVPASLWLIACPERELAGKRYLLNRHESFLIGRRVERGGLALNDPRLSRVHARVAWDGRAASFRVADLDSANGTFVNGERSSIATLEDGTVFRVGDALFVFTSGDELEQSEERLTRAAASNSSVLLLGETGTGKELAARRLHEQSSRRGPFVAVNCGALPRELLTDELFGHQRGAFSGAREERLGLFRAADGGTLFLDEIGDMPLELQPALLRVLQEGSVRPVGSERELPIDVRVIAATHQNLPAKVSAGTFRLDLYTRLAQVEIRLLPLRKRRHVLPTLLASLAETLDLGALSVSTDALEGLALAPWVGNVRELQSLLVRLKMFGPPPFALDSAFLAREAPALLLTRRRSVAPPGAKPAADDGDSITRERLLEVLSRHDGKILEAANTFGVSRSQVYRWLKRFGIHPPRGRTPGT